MGVNTEQNCEVTFLIPCLNEEISIGVVIQEIQSSFNAGNLNFEVLVADNGSTDSSIMIAQSLGARVIHVESRGYGAAILAGIHSAKGKFVVMGDADGSYTFGDSGIMLEKLRQGNDLVMGNRFAGGIATGAMPFLHKYLGNPVLSFLGRLFFRIKVRDFHCGLRAFEKEAILSLGLSSPGMEFASEMVVMAQKRKLKISEVPVTLKPDLRDRPPHLRTWSDGWRHLRFLLTQSPLWAFLVPACLGAISATAISVMSIIGPTRSFGLDLSYRTSIVLSSLATVSIILTWFFLMAKELLQESSEKTYSRIQRVTPFFTVLFLLGLGILVEQYINWYQSGFGKQPLGQELLLTILGGFLTVSGFISIMGYFLIGIIRSTLDRRE